MSGLRVLAEPFLAEPAQLLPARQQMAFTLMFHIIFVPIGVALPALMLIAEYKGLRRADAVASKLARRWSHVAALTFAVGGRRPALCCRSRWACCGPA
nr:hypothetical protein GCM10020092_065100 [Actinoplanes digitatis]